MKKTQVKSQFQRIKTQRSLILAIFMWNKITIAHSARGKWDFNCTRNQKKFYVRNSVNIIPKSLSNFITKEVLFIIVRFVKERARNGKGLLAYELQISSKGFWFGLCYGYLKLSQTDLNRRCHCNSIWHIAQVKLRWSELTFAANENK